jgi:ABC-type Na+ efflux pump permease subunit
MEYLRQILTIAIKDCISRNRSGHFFLTETILSLFTLAAVGSAPFWLKNVIDDLYKPVSVEFKSPRVPSALYSPLMSKLPGVSCIRVVQENSQSAKEETPQVCIELKEKDLICTILDPEREDFIKPRINYAIKKARTSYLEERLQEKGLSRQPLKPFTINEINENILTHVIYIVAILWFAAVTSSAINTAEVIFFDEDSSMIECILSTPVLRSCLILGKCVAVFALALFAGSLSLIAIALGLLVDLTWFAFQAKSDPHLAQAAEKITPLIGPLPVVFYLMLPIAIVLIVLFWTSFTFMMSANPKRKELRSSLSSWISLVGSCSALPSLLPATTLNLGTMLIPGLNLSLSIKSILLETPSSLTYIPFMLTSISIILFVWLGTRSFDVE